MAIDVHKPIHTLGEQPMKSTTLVNAGGFMAFMNTMTMMGVRFGGATPVDENTLSVTVEGSCIPAAKQVKLMMWKSHTDNTSTLKIEWIPVASDSDDQGEEE
jgi:uncharacterized protein YaaQ